MSKVRTTGASMTRKGKKVYRGKKKHWYVYFYDDDGKFKKRQISAIQVPYYGSLIRRRKSYLCPSCGKKFRSMTPDCPSCGKKANRLERAAPIPPPSLSDASKSAGAREKSSV